VMLFRSAVCVNTTSLGMNNDVTRVLTKTSTGKLLAEKSSYFPVILSVILSVILPSYSVVKKLKKSKKLDVRVSKILFIELAVMALFTSFLVLSNNENNEVISSVVSAVLFIVGMLLFYPCFIKDERTVINWAEKTGNHEVMFVFIAISYGLSSLLKRGS
jgi:Kef-type K+ transport system membrane component KefB